MLCRTLTGDQIYLYGKSVIVKFTGKRKVISTGPINGGYQEHLSSIFNHDLNPEEGQPKVLRASTYEEHMALVAKDLGLDPAKTTGIATSVCMKNVAIKTENYRGLEVTAIATAGVEGNAGRAGDPASYDEREIAEALDGGTINLILLINTNLTPGALARCLITSTEAKTAVLQELMIDSRYSSGLATGTGTDGTIVVCDGESETLLTNAGKHTKLGELIGRTVKSALKETLLKQGGICEASQHNLLQRWRRYGLTIERLWQYYCSLEHSNCLLKHIFFEKLAAWAENDTLVVLSSLYIHLLDQSAWQLITDQEAKEAAEMILAKLYHDFAVVAQWRQPQQGESFQDWGISCFTEFLIRAIIDN